LVYNASDHRLLANLGVGFYSAFSADGETLFSSGVNGLIAYDTRTWRQIGPPVLPLDRNLGRIGEVAAATEQQSVGREHLVVTSIGATRGLGATVFNADERRAGIEIGTTLNVNVVALSKDGHSLVLGGLDGTIEIWPSSGGSLDGAVSAPLRQGGKIESVSLTDDSRTLVSTSEDGSTVVWDLLGQGAMSRGHMLRGVVGFNALVAASPVGSNVVVSVNATSAVDVASRPNATSVVDVASRPPRVVRDLGRQAAPCAIDPTGTKVLFSGRSSVTGEPENTITNVDGGQPQTVLRGETVVCAANGGPYVIAAAGDPFVGGQPFVVTDVWRGRKLGSFSLDPSLAAQSLVAVVDGQGRRVAIVDGAGAVVVRDARSGRPDGKPIVATAPTTALAFSSGGDELAIGRHDGTVQRYAVPSLRKIGAPLGGHTLAIRAIAYQPGGLLLASASYDAVDIVDRATNERVATIPYAGGDPLLVDRFTTPGKGTVQFAHGGRILLTNGYSPAGATRAVPALLWPMAPSEWIAAACQAAGRNLTRDEWSQNVGTGVPYHRTCPQWPTGA
jgi:WD40 repeat protein